MSEFGVGWESRGGCVDCAGCASLAGRFREFHASASQREPIMQSDRRFLAEETTERTMTKPWDMGRQVGGIGKALGMHHAFDEPEAPRGPSVDRVLLGRVLMCFRPYRRLALLSA